MILIVCIFFLLGLIAILIYAITNQLITQKHQAHTSRLLENMKSSATSYVSNKRMADVLCSDAAANEILYDLSISSRYAHLKIIR